MGLFAAVHIYWGFGGRGGLPSGFSLFTNRVLLAINFIAIPLSLLGALLALALVRPWGLRLRRSLLLLGAWGTSALLVAHAAPAVPEWVSLILGEAPAELSPADRFSLFLYEPYWLLGGILFGLAASSSRPRLRSRGSGSSPR